MTAGVLILDCNGRVSHATTDGANLFGLAGSELLGLTLSELEDKLSPLGGPSLTQAIDRSAETAGPVSFSFHRADGVHKEVAISAANLITAQPGLCTVLSISALPASEWGSLASSLERYRLIAESALDDIVIVNAQGRVEYLNRFAAQRFGKEPASLVGRRVAELFPAEQWERMQTNLSSVFQKGEPNSFEGQFHFPSGTRWLHTRLIPISDETGAISSILAVSSDITEQKQAEEVLQERDRAIRQAYIEVFSAVTGERLIIMTAEELDAALGAPVSDPYRLRRYEDLAGAREMLRRALHHRFPGFRGASDLLIAASEAAANAIKHAGGGVLHMAEKTGGRVPLVQILIEDWGPGIDFTILPRATLLKGYSTKPSLGLGFSLMLEACDRVRLSTEPGHTRVLLEIPSDRMPRPRSSLDLRAKPSPES